MRARSAALVVVVCVAGCNSSGELAADAALDGPFDAVDAPVDDPMLQGVQTYFKASNTQADDRFGFALALAGDGQTLAVGAPFEDSRATGIDGDHLDNSVSQAGAVYVFARSGGIWAQQAYVKASNPDAGDRFGSRIALSDDGNTLAVGAPQEASCATGVDGSQSDNSCGASGAVYVFARVNGIWAQQAYVKAATTRGSHGLGSSLALSGDGNTLASGQPGDPSTTVGIDGNQADAAGSNNGSVCVFTRSGTTWSQQAYVKGSTSDRGDLFGVSVALSSGGDVLAVGAIGEASGAKGVNGSQLDNGKFEAGAVFVFARTNARWTQDAYIKASNTDERDAFGSSVALSASGTTLAVGATGESSGATGIDGDQADNSELMAGAVYAFARVGGAWAQQAYVKGERSRNGDNLGRSVWLSANGNLLAVGAPNELNGTGAAYVFRRTGTAWAQQHRIEALNAAASDGFAASVSLSRDGRALAAGASAEDSFVTGVGGNPADNSAMQSGAAYLVE